MGRVENVLERSVACNLLLQTVTTPTKRPGDIVLTTTTTTTAATNY